MMRLTVALLASIVASSSAIELTKETWDEGVAGKTVLVKYFASWCGHCKRMKPDWDKLMTAFKDHPTTAIVDVECTAGGKSLCDEVGVRGYPTIKYGDPNDLQDYKGGRDFAALKKFADGLGPQCSPANMDLCDDAKKAQIKEFMALGSDKLATMIKEKDAEVEKLESDFKSFVDGLQKQYSEASDKKDKDVEDVKSSGLGLMKSVSAHLKTNPSNAEL